MSYYDRNDLGLTYIDEADLSYPDYSFDLVGAWKDSEGRIYISTDSGCSCPTPWQNHGTIDDFTGPMGKGDAITEALSLWKNQGGYDPEAFTKFIQAVQAA